MHSIFQWGKLDNVCTNLEHLFLCKNGLCQKLFETFLAFSEYMNVKMKLFTYLIIKSQTLFFSVRQYRNCKLDNVCTNLEHLFLCENGLCQNITSAFDCHYTKSQHPVDCKDKRQCITLNGLYECHDGQCAKVIGHCSCFLGFLSKKYFREISILGTYQQ